MLWRLKKKERLTILAQPNLQVHTIRTFKVLLSCRTIPHSVYHHLREPLHALIANIEEHLRNLLVGDSGLATEAEEAGEVDDVAAV